MLAPDETAVYQYTFFVGPKSQKVLREAGNQLDEVFFYTSWRWFRALCLFLMWLLNWLYSYVPNYGWCIIWMTIILRVVTQPFVQFGMKSNARFMQVQKKLKPELDEIVKKYKDNPQKRNEETFKLYKKHNANPLGMMKGCFWMFLQMPIFFALFKLLNGSIELRGAAFLWIQDLSQADHMFALPAWVPFIQYFNLLPILMTATQFLTTMLTPTTATDPSQKTMMYMMPLIFMFILYEMSAGLVLYWFVSNLWQVGSQLIINRGVKKEEEQKEHQQALVPAAKAEEAAADGAEKLRRRRGRG